MEKRSIAVVGVGAIGGSIAADLADIGHRVVLCSRSPFANLVVTHPAGVSKLEGASLRDPAQVEADVDWVLLATKAHQTPSAKPWLDRLCDGNARLAVLQNGVDHAERVEPLVSDRTAVVPVVVQLPAEKTAPGAIDQSRAGTLIVSSDRDAREFASLFDGARTRVESREDFVSQAWWKLLSNAALGGVCALALRPNGAATQPEARALVLALMREVVEVGRAEGARLPDDAPEKVLARILEAASDHWSSIAVDRRAGRPMEWEARNAVVGRLGRRHQIATPLNDAITALLALADVS